MEGREGERCDGSGWERWEEEETGREKGRDSGVERCVTSFGCTQKKNHCGASQLSFCISNVVAVVRFFVEVLSLSLLLPLGNTKTHYWHPSA